MAGGGHNPSGCSSSDGGIVIDLSYLNKVNVDQDARIAQVQGGALWSDVDDATTPLGLATVGGTVNSVSALTTFLCSGTDSQTGVGGYVAVKDTKLTAV
jgi:FAD/FMN-containing dehydrogenase